ncbi:MAG: 3-deoxy-D-manno-octulosonic acid transferase [Bosea sp. (in: a-proteobacteria)]
MSHIALPWPLKLYRGASAALEPAAALTLRWRLGKGKEDGARLGERRGHAGLDRPEGTLIWAHGASVGETLSLMPIIERLTQRGHHVLVTSGTVTSAGLMARRLPPGALHQYLPLDVPRYMRRFLKHWRPDMALIAESEIWPNMIIEARRRDIPLVMVNARMSQRSYLRWRKRRDSASALLSAFDLCLAQSQGDAERIARLGAPRVANTGNLKFDVPAPPADPVELARLEGLTAGRPIWLAASTHPGEDERIIDAHHALLARHPKLLTIIAPRHPARGGDIENDAMASGLSAARRSAGIAPDTAVDVYVADTVGELGLFYRLSPVVMMGGSLVAHGGQNPIEPAKLGAAILHGPHVTNFAEVYAALDEAGGARLVADTQGLAETASHFLKDRAAARASARIAGATVAGLGGAAERIMLALDPMLMRIAFNRTNA